MRSYKDSVKLFSQPLEHQIEELYSAPYLVLHRADLHNVLVQEADRLGATIHLNSQCKRINFSEPSVEFCNGKKYDADVILGAVGERSACRDALFGYNMSSQDSGDHIYRTTVKASEVALHKGFDAPGTATMCQPFGPDLVQMP